MKVRLTADHYFPYDQWIGAGTEVDLANPAYGWKVGGKYSPLSRAMEPLDEEADKALRDQFKEEQIDPISKLPIKAKPDPVKPYEPPKYADPLKPNRVPGAGPTQPKEGNTTDASVPGQGPLPPVAPGAGMKAVPSPEKDRN